MITTHATGGKSKVPVSSTLNLDIERHKTCKSTKILFNKSTQQLDRLFWGGVASRSQIECEIVSNEYSNKHTY